MSSSALSSSALSAGRCSRCSTPLSSLLACSQAVSLLLLTASCLALVGCAHQLFYTPSDRLLAAGLLLGALNVAQQLLLVVAVVRSSCRLLKF